MAFLSGAPCDLSLLRLCPSRLPGRLSLAGVPVPASLRQLPSCLWSAHRPSTTSSADSASPADKPSTFVRFASWNSASSPEQAQSLYSSKEPKNKAFQFVHCWRKVRNCPKFQALESHKRSRPKKSSTPFEAADEEEEDDSTKNITSDSSQPSAKKRPMSRKQAKDKLKNGGEAGSYKEVMKDLAHAKEKEVTLKQERWRETEEIEERKLLLGERKLRWDLMFYDVSTMEPHVRTYVLAMRAHIAASKVAALNGGFGATSGGFGSGSGGSGGGIDDFGGEFDGVNGNDGG